MSNLLYKIVLLISDFLFLSTVFFIAKYFDFEISYFNFFFNILIIIVIFYYENIYNFRYDFWQETKKIFRSLFFSLLIILSIMSFIKTAYSFVFVIVYFILLFIFFPVYRRILKRVLFKSDFFKERVKIIDYSNKLQKEIKENWYIGMLNDDKKFNIVLINSEHFDVNSLYKEIEKYLYTKRIYLIPYLNEIDFSNSEIFEYQNVRLNVINIENKLLKINNILLKNIFDFLLVIAVLPFFLILHLFISVLIKLDSKGSVFFKQKRIGKDGKIFTCYKYRTMYENGDEILKEYLKTHPEEVEYYKKYHKYKNNPGITRIGKILRTTSLDELPQILNILRSEMSFVGPRPYMIEEINEIKESDIILKVKPGISGLWQVSGRNNLTFQQRINLDKWYIKNWSLWLDFVILIKTLKVVIFKIGAK